VPGLEDREARLLLAAGPGRARGAPAERALSTLQAYAGNRAVQALMAGTAVARTTTLVTGEAGEQDTETATRTAVPGPGTPGAAPAPSPGSCSAVTATATLPSGNLPATVSGSKLGASWTMAADFTGTPNDPAVCGPCGEYRQYVRGKFAKNGNPVTHRLAGVDLDPSTFHEDGAIIGGTTYKYGYHSIRFANSRFSQPDQATGQRWDGFDHPGITGSSGDTLSVDLDFRGETVDTCNGATLGTSSWSVKGTTRLP